jgi:hypothetical protein
MMRTPDVGNLHDPAASKGGLDRPHVRRILVEREMRARPVIIREVRDQRASQMPLAENDDMVQTLAPDRTDQSSAKGFCQGLWGAVRTSSIPIPFTRFRKASP